MNGSPIVVFVEGAFECVVLCATSDIAHAWAMGAGFGAAEYAGHNFHTVRIGRVRSIAEAEVELDDALADDFIKIDRIEREKACQALERAISEPFPAVPTIVK